MTLTYDFMWLYVTQVPGLLRIEVISYLMDLHSCKEWSETSVTWLKVFGLCASSEAANNSHLISLSSHKSECLHERAGILNAFSMFLLTFPPVFPYYYDLLFVGFHTRMSLWEMKHTFPLKSYTLIKAMAVPNTIQSCLHNGSIHNGFIRLFKWIPFVDFTPREHCVLAAVLYFSSIFDLTYYLVLL